MRAPTRAALLALSGALVLALPSVAFAQATEHEEEEEQPAVTDAREDAAAAGEDGDADRAEENATHEGGYEPDQRGFDGGSGGGGGGDGGGGYEPDQRGDTGDEADSEPGVQEASMSASESYGGGGDRFMGFDTTVFLGPSLTGLDAAGGDNLVLSTQQGAFGASFGASLGLRLGPVSFGPRFAFVADPSFVLGTFGLDVSVALLRERITPTVRASVGYVALFSLSDSLPSQSQVAVSGVSTELALGVRWTFASPFVVGAELAGTWMHLGRAAAPDCVTGCDDGAFDLRRGGQSDALGLRLHVYVGIAY